MERKNKIMLIIMISLSSILLLGTSYSMLKSMVLGNNPYIINVGTLRVEFQNNNTEKLNLENMYPMSDKEGESQDSALKFVVKNTGNIDARYNVYIEETSTNPPFKDVIRFISNKNDLGYNEPKTLGMDEYVDYSATLKPSESANYQVKTWLDYDADNTYMNKTFSAKLIVNSSQVGYS